MHVGPEECECEAPMSTACGAIPQRAWIALRAASTEGRRIASASSPTRATRMRPSSNTAARTLHASWNTR